MLRLLSRALVAGTLTAALVTTVAIFSASAGTAPRRIVNGWLPYWSMSASLNAVAGNPDLWGEASPFWYRATGATTITKHSGAGDTTVVNTLRGHGIKVVPTVTESLNAAAMATLLADQTQRQAHVATLVDLVTANGYDGIDLDYEAMNFGGTSTDRAAVRSRFVTLVRELGEALHAKERLLSVTVGARTRSDDPNWSVFDYAGLAPSVDRFRIMTYDYHWSGGSPGAVAPLGWVNTVLTYAVSVVPPSKVEAGVPLYGYDWPADPTQPDGYGTATSRSYRQAEALREQHGTARQWSATHAAPYFTYTDVDGVDHVVWYNDAQATEAKMTLIEEYGIRGLAFWAVGYEDTAQWASLRSYATQKNTQLVVTAPAAVTYGTTATVTGTLTTTSGAAVAGEKVTLQWRSAIGTRWRSVATGTTSATGTVALRYAPGSNGYFRLTSPASWSYTSSTSIAVKTRVAWRVSAAFADATIAPGTTARLTGKVAPIRSGATVQRQQYVNGSWVTKASTTLRSDGTYTFTFTPSAAGTYTYRVAVPGTELNATGHSATVQLEVS